MESTEERAERIKRNAQIEIEKMVAERAVEQPSEPEPELEAEVKVKATKAADKKAKADEAVTEEEVPNAGAGE